jgi:hypothetical protein
MKRKKIEFKGVLNTKLVSNIDQEKDIMIDDINSIWNNLKDCLKQTAEEVIGLN